MLCCCCRAMHTCCSVGKPLVQELLSNDRVLACNFFDLQYDSCRHHSSSCMPCASACSGVRQHGMHICRRCMPWPASAQAAASNSSITTLSLPQQCTTVCTRCCIACCTSPSNRACSPPRSAPCTQHPGQIQHSHPANTFAYNH